MKINSIPNTNLYHQTTVFYTWTGKKDSGTEGMLQVLRDVFEFDVDYLAWVGTRRPSCFVSAVSTIGTYFAFWMVMLHCVPELDS